MIVADFMEQRAGVYFEAGSAFGLGRPVIWTARKADLKNVHFDSRPYNFILWTDGSLPALWKVLANRIVALIGNGPNAVS